MRSGSGRCLEEAGTGSLSGSCPVLMLQLQFMVLAAARGHPCPHGCPQAEGSAGRRAAARAVSPQCCSMLIVLGCAMLAMVCYTAAAVLCQTAPHHARMHHAVPQLSPCGTGYGNTMHHSTILHHAVLHHAGHAMLGCIMLSVLHWHAASALHLDSCAVSCHATLCHIMLAMPCHAAWCCLC